MTTEQRADFYRVAERMESWPRWYLRLRVWLYKWLSPVHISDTVFEPMIDEIADIVRDVRQKKEER